MIVITAHGRLAHQPELKMLRQTSVCEFRLLANRFARGEEHVEAVTFFCYGEEAEAFCERVEKGQLVSATGTQETQRWTDGSGQDRTFVKYKLTWWEAGPRPKPRGQEPASTGRQQAASGQHRRETSRSRVAAAPPAQEQGRNPPAPGLI
ncbi:single-stranded DNA-binding protein [Ramlibacter sp. AN1133]|uniref:single-stranded DNA-binding protein n=1 Tax=Ramlibacter sp. AN1133 TaxID=3133429 RepID=UPI0030BBD7F4